MPRINHNTQEVYKELSKAIQSPFNLVLEGESEVGKEYFAKLIHQERNWGGEFVAYDCEQTGQKQEDMVKQLTSPLFSEQLRRSPLKDTFFIRRIDLLKGHLHAQLSDFFGELAERGDFTRKELLSLGMIGSVQAGGHRESLNNVQLNRFLDILFCLRIKILPLRERKREIPKLVETFISFFNQEQKRKVEGVAPDTLEMLVRYDWPNNVCELRMEIERAITLTKDHELIEPVALSEHLVQSMTRTRSLG